MDENGSPAETVATNSFFINNFLLNLKKHEKCIVNEEAKLWGSEYYVPISVFSVIHINIRLKATYSHGFSLPSIWKSENFVKTNCKTVQIRFWIRMCMSKQV